MMMNPSLPVVTIPALRLHLTLDQIVTAARQLNKDEQTELINALTETELNRSMKQLIDELYSKPPVDNITDEEIMAEINAVRELNRAK